MATSPEKSSQPIKRVRRATKSIHADGPSSPSSAEPVISASAAVEAAPAPSRPAFGTTTVREKDVTRFLRQLVLLQEAGMPILKSLRTLSTRTKKASVQTLVGDIAHSVENGNALWQAFDRHPRHFETVFVNLIKASEASGTLVPVLKRLATHREKREMLARRVNAALIYPVIVVVTCLAAVLIISKIVIPEFMKMFTALGVALPAFTRVFVGCVDFFGDWWWAGILILVGLIVLYKVWVRNPLNRLRADRIKLMIPIMGPIVKSYSVAEMTRGLALLLRSGMSMMVTLDLVRSAIHNRAVAQVLQRVRDSVEHGGGFEQPLREAEGIIPSVVTDMLVTGEESGQLDKIAEHVAEVYEEEVAVRLSSLGDVIQPVITLIIGAFVLMTALAVFIPLISMVDKLTGAGGGAL